MQADWALQLPWYLASAGVGKLTIVDEDTVDLTNLQRQVIHRMSTLGLPKVLSAKVTLQEMNPDVRVVPLMIRPGKRVAVKFG